MKTTVIIEGDKITVEVIGAASVDVAKLQDAIVSKEPNHIQTLKDDEPALFIQTNAGIIKKATPDTIAEAMGDLDPDQILEVFNEDQAMSLHENLTAYDIELIQKEFPQWKFLIDGLGQLRISRKTGERILRTDQSMEQMADNEIVFENRPSFSEVCFKMNVNNQRAMRHFEKHEGLHFNDLQPLSSEHTRMLCDHYGFKANIQWPEDYPTE